MIKYKVKWKSYVSDLYLPIGEVRRVVVLVPGLPKSSNPRKIIQSFVDDGMAVVYPDFSGSFDSGGFFDGMQCIKDVGEFIDFACQREVTELYYGSKIKLNRSGSVALVGMSFGALAALLGYDERVSRLALLSPAFLYDQSDVSSIIDFDFSSQMSSLVKLLENAFPYTYRVKSMRALSDFLHGQVPLTKRKNIETVLDKLKIPTLILHGKSDTSVPWQVSKDLQEKSANNLITWNFPSSAHSTSSYTAKSLSLINDFLVG